MHELSNFMPAQSGADKGHSPGGIVAYLCVLVLLAVSTGATFWIGAVLTNHAHQPAASQMADEIVP